MCQKETENRDRQTDIEKQEGREEREGKEAGKEGQKGEKGLENMGGKTKLNI